MKNFKTSPPTSLGKILNKNNHRMNSYKVIRGYSWLLTFYVINEANSWIYISKIYKNKTLSPVGN